MNAQKLFHLYVMDSNDDARFDRHYFFTHPDETKTQQDLVSDYRNGEELVYSSSKNDWSLEDILRCIYRQGWVPIEVQTAQVSY